MKASLQNVAYLKSKMLHIQFLFFPHKHRPDSQMKWCNPPPKHRSLSLVESVVHQSIIPFSQGLP